MVVEHFTVKGDGRRPLKSLSELLKGKQGRFRQNLTRKTCGLFRAFGNRCGARAEAWMQCGLPKQMALELYKPFIIQKLEEEGYVHTGKISEKIC
jgi:DNA-directed RNA polymerase subunit beta'